MPTPSSKVDEDKFSNLFVNFHDDADDKIREDDDAKMKRLSIMTVMMMMVLQPTHSQNNNLIKWLNAQFSYHPHI